MDNSRVSTLVTTAIDTLIADLEAGRSETLTAYLTAMSRFHKYSFNNAILIHAQCKIATQVAGYKTWFGFGRHVKRGAKGIVILVPMVYRRRDQKKLIEKEPEECSVGFTTGFVFDVSQTEGEPIPEFAKVKGAAGCYLQRLKSMCSRRNISVSYKESLSGAEGISTGGAIALLDKMQPAVEFAVLTHELAHEILHKGDRRHATCKTLRETEAEAVAYIVSTAVGLDPGTSSSDYIQLYQGDANLLISSLSFIQMTASEILEGIL